MAVLFHPSLGKAPGIALLAIFFTGVVTTLVCVGKITSAEFVSCFQFLVTTFFGGSALAAFRDSFGAGNAKP
jgi:hypothetical protein